MSNLSEPASHRTLYDWSPQSADVLSGYGTGVVPQSEQRLAAIAHSAHISRATMNNSRLLSMSIRPRERCDGDRITEQKASAELADWYRELAVGT